MPVTAKLSRHFYDQLGDEVANELVNWFNAVDETYRNQLRELNELNWERFRSELRAESTGIRAETGSGFSSIRAEMDKRFAEMDTRFERVEASFPALEQRIDAKFARCETRMYKAMFAFWTATIIPLAALILALDGVFQR